MHFPQNIQLNQTLFTRRPAFWLLVSLVLLILAPLPMTLFPKFQYPLFALLLSFLVLAGLIPSYRYARRFAIGLILGVAAILSIWLDFVSPQTPGVILSRPLLLMLFSAHLGSQLFQLIYHSPKVDQNVIYASVAGYLLIGMIGGQACQLLEAAYPHSFNYSGENALYDFQYFSFVTLTTLGYGDITPANQPAKAITLMISLKGQLYLTIIIAMLVGKYVAGAVK